MGSRRGQISIDKIVAIRSSVLPLYIILRDDGQVTALDEVSEDGNDFVTTSVSGNQISFKSSRGYYLSAEGDQVCTRRYCSANERFTVEKRDTQYAFKARSGKYLSISDRPPYMGLAPTCDETEVFQLFSLMMYGVNVGKQLESLERNGTVMIDGLLDEDQVANLRSSLAAEEAGERVGHETRSHPLANRGPGFDQLAVHPIVMQLVRRMTSPAVKLSSVESCRTNADHVRKELEQTTWHVVHPYSSAEFPGVVDEKISFTVTWFLDDLTTENSTWSWVKPPPTDGMHSPKLPQLSSPEELEAIVKDAKQLVANKGSAWFYLGPVWMSNNVGAASYWKDYDAQTRYKHMSGQKEHSSFRALSDAQMVAETREELCPTLVQATYVREYVTPRELLPSLEELVNRRIAQEQIGRSITLY